MNGKRLLGLALLSIVLTAGTAAAGADEGKKVFESKKCGQCHQVEGPAKEKTIQDQLARKGPELWYSGNKFKKEFLSGWLANPRPIRPLEYYSLTKKNAGNHPKLGQKDANDVTEYLMSLKAPSFKAAGIQPSVNPKGRIIFIKKQACYGCHEVTTKGTTAGGQSGPRLTDAGKRLNPDWIYSYLANPKVYKPVKDMPNYEGILNDEEMKSLAEFVSTL